jgi:phosphoinositide-3-kinase regulatory subunit 4
MISQMLARDPKDRPSFDHILSTFRGSIFPEYFYIFLKDYVNSLSEGPESLPESDGFLKKMASQPGTKVDRLIDEWESVSINLDQGSDEGRFSYLAEPNSSSDGPAILLLNIVTSSIRNCLWPSNRLHGLQLFSKLCPHLQDEDRIDRIIPFVVELLSDEVAVVRAEACRVLVEVVRP